MIVEILLVGVSALMLLLSLIVMGLVSMTLGMGPPLVLQRFPAAPAPAAAPAPPSARTRSPYTHRAVMRARKYPWRVNLKRLERWRPPPMPEEDAAIAAALRKEHKRSDSECREATRLVV